MNNKRGYTMVEMLVVIFIIATILGITIPRLNRSTEGTKLKTTVHSITALLETAKSFATTQNVECAAVYNAGAQKIYLSKQDIDDVDNDGDTSEMMQFEKGVSIPTGVGVSFTADNMVIFKANGSVKSPDGTITVQAASINKSKTISVNTVTGFVAVT